MNELFLEPKQEFNVGNYKKYKVKTIRNSTVNAKEAERHLQDLYYLVFWKNYSEEKSNWETFSTVMHLQKIIFKLHKNYPKKPTATFLLLILLCQ